MGENIVNFYSGAPPLNRLSFHRHSSALLTQHLLNPLTVFTVFRGGQPLVSSSSKTISFLPFASVRSLLGSEPFFQSDTDPENGAEVKHLQGARPAGAARIVFLGVDEKDLKEEDKTKMVKDGKGDAELNSGSPPVFALDATDLEGPDVDRILFGGEEGEGSVKEREFAEPRGASSHWGAWEAGVFAVGRSLTDWNARNKFCAGCGSEVYSAWGGWKLLCKTVLSGSSTCPSTKGLHNYAYPRTDPVLIMAIISTDGESVLLGRQRAWPTGMYSCLAGFAEPGESIEDAVRREVYEESGVVVKEVMYASSQPWPYPSNLMLGCYGRADPSQTIRLDLDNELEDARWFTRQEILDILADPKLNIVSKEEAPSFNPGAEPAAKKEKALKHRLPPRTAIAGVLTAEWAQGNVRAFGEEKQERLMGRM